MENDMYKVKVLWGNKSVTHKAWSLVSAKQWMYAYPKADVFIKVVNMFGRTVAVRYCR
jgi:hypothetical protein